jgi:hypothetical protein
MVRSKGIEYMAGGTALTDRLEKRALVGKATATPKTKSMGKRKSQSPPLRRRMLDTADFVIHGYNLQLGYLEKAPCPARLIGFPS